MGYQSGLLGAVGSIGSAVSIATLLHRQSPEYQAKVEKERIRIQAAENSRQLSNKAEFLKNTVPKEKDGEVNKDRYDTAYEFQKEAYNTKMQAYMNDPDPKYIESGKKNYQRMMGMDQRYQDAVFSLNKAKEEKRNQKRIDDYNRDMEELSRWESENPSGEPQPRFEQKQPNKEAK